MKTTKLFFMAALALMTAACSNDDNDFAQQPAEQAANGEITITATVSSDEGATTRALSIDGSNIASTWETTDEFAILFNDGSNNVNRTATVQSINGSNVTITFTIPESLASNTACTIVYPASAANAANTGADVATALAAQDGTIGNCPEVRVGTATIDKDNHSLSDVTKLAAQNAIFKFTLQDLSDAAKSATEFKVSDNSGNVITTVTPGSASGELYVALPVMAAGTYWFNATIDSKPYIAKATTAAATVAGKYYQSTMKMATLGDVIKTDGKFYAAGTEGAVAMIAYLGSDTYDATFKNGLAIALDDEGSMNWSTAVSTCGAKTPITGAKWCLPSQEQWKQMFKANGGNNASYTDLNTTINNAGGTILQENALYWSSSEYRPNVQAYRVGLDGGSAVWNYGKESNGYLVRACLAF
jgi:hypothetical protein